MKRSKYDFVGTAEAAEILGVERPRIGRWQIAGIMPEPVVRLAATPVWRRQDILKLKEQRKGTTRRRKATPIAA